jgi:hypothetical protein
MSSLGFFERIISNYHVILPTIFFKKNKVHNSLFLNVDLMCTPPTRSSTNLTRFEYSFFPLDLKGWKDYQNAMDLIDLYELEMLN